MNVNIKGNPGTDNAYTDVRMAQVGNYNPQARTVVNHLHASPGGHRLATLYDRLQEEYQGDERLQRRLDDIRRYRTRLPHTIGLEAKLRDGGFAPIDIADALRSKQAYSKKCTRYQYFESAQRIDGYLYARLSHLFDTYVMPLIREGRPLPEVRQTVYEQVIQPVMEQVDTCGAQDRCLCYTEDDLYGMLYYLTGNCHINWACYDIPPSL